MTEALDTLVAAVRASRKYATVSEDLVRTVGARELAFRRSTKEAIKATKNKLHQVAAAYLEPGLDYDRALSALRAAADDAAREAVLRSVMAQHASTRERLPIVDRFFAETLAGLAPQTVVDLACGLNPLAWPWMGLPPAVTYSAYDIYGDMMGFLGQALALLGASVGAVAVRDVLHNPPREPVDLALLLKALPCLDQIDKGAVQRLLTDLPARQMLVSFPVASLGGRKKGMPTHYGAQFEALAAERGWRIERYDFETELAYRVTRDGD